MDRPLFRQSLEMQALTKLLLDESHGEVFTYEEMSVAIGGDVLKHRSAIQSAVRCAQREKSLVFETIRNVGIKRASDSEIVEGRFRDVARIRGVARRGLKKIECVKDVAALPADRKTQLNVLISGLGVISHATTSKAQALIEQRVIRAQDKLPVAETLAALGKS